MGRKLAAEFLGTFWLVLVGCGAAILASTGIGVIGVSLAFGLGVMTMAYAVGGISGGHFNPAVSLGLTVAGRFPPRDLVPYWFAQVMGAVLAGGVLFAIASGKAGFFPGAFASNGYAGLSPGGYSAQAAFLTEVLMTAGFVLVILGVTSDESKAGWAPLAIGLALTLIHIVSIPVTNTSVNPARSTGVAIVASNGALGQLWMFWVAPLLGGALGALFWRRLLSPDRAEY